MNDLGSSPAQPGSRDHRREADGGHWGEEAGGSPDAGASRGDFLRRAILAGGAAAAGGLLVGGLPRLASSAPSARQDREILNFLLGLEQLKAAFYADAAEKGELDGELQRLAEVVGGHEQEHVSYLRRALGDAAREEPEFDFGNSTTNRDAFLRTALLLEENAVSAYVGQGANVTRRRMVALGRMASVEGRHAAWVRDLLGRNAAPLAADEAKTARAVTAAIRKTGFVR